MNIRSLGAHVKRFCLREEVPNNNFHGNFKFQLRKFQESEVELLGGSMKYASDLGDRTYEFAREVALFCRKLTRLQENLEYSRQVLRSSSSVGANYIEANDALGRKDFMMRIRICRKEVKETAYFLRLLGDLNVPPLAIEARRLLVEADELRKIFSAILIKMGNTPGH